MSALDIATGGNSDLATGFDANALSALQSITAPNEAALTLPELQQYAVAMNMTPAQMQAFLQQNNALASENVDQTGTDAQQQALAQLANVANQGAAGDATEQAQQSQIQNAANEQIGGQVGAINQAAEARGVPVGLLQAALSQQAAGQGVQQANQAALTAQSGNYQTALNALANQGTLGSSLQSQQNTQANTVAQAQNAMQQFNAANQQAASATNANLQQQANAQNTQNANQTAAANTSLANQRTQYNATVPQMEFQDQLQQANDIAHQYDTNANTATGQGQQTAGLYGSLIGGLGSAITAGSGNSGNTANTGSTSGMDTSSPSYQQNSGAVGAETMANSGSGYAYGGLTGGVDGYCSGGMPMKAGGFVPGKAKVHGDSKVNDTVPVRVSPGEAVIPRTVVQQNPADVMRLLAAGSNPQGAKPPMPMQRPGMPMAHPIPGQNGPMPPQPQPGHDPKDIAALLMAMKHLRGAK